MFILLTNDDGIHAPGLLAMWRELKEIADVQVVAPETVQSATGHGITVATPLLTSEVKIEGAFTGIAVDGRPADCVKLAINKLVKRAPDLVVSGLNSGVNVGINVIYSGTVAAAIEAAFLGLPSIAVSLHLKNDLEPDYARAARMGRDAIDLVLAAGIGAGQVASINIPALAEHEQPTGVKVCRQCTRPWVDTYEQRQSPRGQKYFWNSSNFSLGTSDQDTDVAAVRDRYIAVTPLQFDLTHYPMLKEWEQTEWRLPGSAPTR